MRKQTNQFMLTRKLLLSFWAVTLAFVATFPFDTLADEASLAKNSELDYMSCSSNIVAGLGETNVESKFSYINWISLMNSQALPQAMQNFAAQACSEATKSLAENLTATAAAYASLGCQFTTGDIIFGLLSSSAECKKENGESCGNVWVTGDVVEYKIGEPLPDIQPPGEDDVEKEFPQTAHDEDRDYAEQLRYYKQTTVTVTFEGECTAWQTYSVCCPLLGISEENVIKKESRK